MGFYSKVILDSIAPNGKRLTTLELRYPRFIHSEFMTHRMFCLSGDSIIQLVSPKDSLVRSVRLDKFVHGWLSDDELSEESAPDIKIGKAKEFKIFQLNEKQNALQDTTVENAMISGIKEIYKVVAGKHTISGSKDHRIYTSKGWKTIEQLAVGDSIMVLRFGSAEPEKITSILMTGSAMTFDLEVGGEFENFFANGVVVHNSRNAASSRAIPVKKMIEMIEQEPAMPIHWGKAQSGMQADNELDSEAIEKAKLQWLKNCADAIEGAKALLDMGLHKQIINRGLEPYMWMTTIVTATEWENFFKLRRHKDAQPELHHLADLMFESLQNSVPVAREWHLPYIQDDEQNLPLETKQKVSVARCARVSYLTHDGKRSIDKDLELHERLVHGSDVGHHSPFEHQAKALSTLQIYGNFIGWLQYRKLIETT